MRTRDAVKQFMISRGNLQPSTRRLYRQHLAPFEAAFPQRLPEKPIPIQRWLNGEASRLAPSTATVRFGVVRALYAHLSRTHRSLANPMPQVRPPRVRATAMRTFTDDEKYALFTLPLCPRDRALLTLFLDTGIRRGELATLTWGHVTPSYILVSGKTGENVVPISDATFRLLEQLRHASSPAEGDRVFQGKRGPLSAHGIYLLVRRLCRRAGIKGKRASPHTFRATFATSYAGEDACNPQALQRILGHQDFNTTLRYINASQRQIMDNHRLCTPLRGLEALAQGRLIRDQEEAVQEAEEIVAKREAT